MPENGPRGGGSRFLYEPFDPSMDREMREYLEIIRSLGSPKQVKESLLAIDVLLEERQRRIWLLTSIRKIASWVAVVLAGWMALRGFIIETISQILK
ncbi:MAG: hypothetical protein AAGG56_16210 [Pseudomonadota bacterium]